MKIRIFIVMLLFFSILSCKNIDVKPNYLLDGMEYTDPFINEFMAVNSHVPFKNPVYLETEVNSIKVYPDWIEIYNPTDKPANLSGWYLTDNDNKITKWMFPENTVIEPFKYLIIFASNKNNSDYPDNFPFIDDLGNIHTNFGLSGNGEYLALVRPDGKAIVQEYNYPEQRGLISYGIDKNGEIGYLSEPTPGSLNTIHYKDFVADTKFSIDRGYYKAPFEVTISTNTKNAYIYYTLDSSTPTEFNGYTYTGPITIDETTVLKAAAYKDGLLPTDVDTQTYFFIENITEQERLNSSYPRNWSRDVPGDYDMNQNIINQYSNMQIENAFFSIPTVSITTDNYNLFGYDDGIYTHSNQTEFSGIMWERESSFEFFNPLDPDVSFQVNCGIRISGESSSILSNTAKLSFRLLFKGGYGPSRLDFPLFDDKDEYLKVEPVNTFDHLMLRSFYNDSWTDSAEQTAALFFRNMFLNKTFLDMGHVSPHGEFVHLYLNGMYWGIYELHERPNSDFQSEYFGYEPEEYDTLNNGKEPAMDGDYSAWNTILELSGQYDGYHILNGINPDGTNNPEKETLINMENLVDYVICNYYFADKDWQWFAGRVRGKESEGFRFFIWDAEKGLNNFSDESINETVPFEIFWNLFNNNEEFKILTSDRIQKHMFYDGALSNDACLKRFNSLAEEINLAVLLEAARWGDNLHESSFTKEDWDTEKNSFINNYFQAQTDRNRTSYVISLFKDLGLYPLIPSPEYLIDNKSMHGGHLTTDRQLLTLTNEGYGEIYYTTDGTDPRLPGGEINTSILYSAPIPLTKTSMIKSRTYNNGKWSALNEAVFTVGLISESLRITEIMFHPASGYTELYNRSDFEFIELKNIGTTGSINLSMIHFTDGITFTFPSFELNPGEYIVLVKDLDAFLLRYPDADPTKVLGPFSGSLNNAGETIVLRDGNDKIIYNFAFSDDWFKITDGTGFSLNVKDPYISDTSLWNNIDIWQPSSVPDGTPLKEDTGTPFIPDAVIINEILAHSHDNAPDWIELYNTTNNPINIGGWFLSDENNPDLTKYEIAEGTIIPAKGYIVFTEDENFANKNDPGCHTPFSLNDDGETVFLTPVINGRIIEDIVSQNFGASETGISLGIHIKSTGKTDFVPLKINTPGISNSDPKTGPVIINEIMYNPEGDGDAEYIELLNTGLKPVVLYNDKLNLFWKFIDEGGIDFNISESGEAVVINPDECILLVKDKYMFNFNFSAPDETRILVWEPGGKLSNGGEEIQLLMPGEIGNNNSPSYILIDIVNYNDKNLWPEAADGTGYSLHRIIPQNYGNDPGNWNALQPSPGIK